MSYLRAATFNGKSGDPFDVAAVINRQDSFQYWQVELLLDQAADLLDRAIRDRFIYDALRADFFRLLMSVVEAHQAKSIHRDETLDGFYALAPEQSTRLASAESVQLTSVKIAKQKLDDVITNCYGVANDVNGNPVSMVMLEAKRQSGFAAADAYPFQGPANVNGDGRQDLAPGGVDRADFLANAALFGALRSETVTEGQVRSRQAELAGEADSGDCTLKARQVQSSWDMVNITHQQDRKRLEFLIDQFNVLSMKSGAPFSYVDQLTQIRSRVMRDFGDAYARLTQARLGLQSIYGHDVPSFPQLDVQANRLPSLDGAVQWTRDAIRFLVAFGHKDQSYALPISLKALVTPAVFTAAMHTAAPTLTFQIPANLFDFQTVFRLRGLYATVETAAASQGAWAIRLSPPRRAFCRFSTDAPGNGHSLDQTEVPSVICSRVFSRESERDPDLYGATVLRNLSPIGDPAHAPADQSWTIFVGSRSSSGEGANTITDIQIDLLVAAQVN